jgi:hypothetical protein
MCKKGNEMQRPSLSFSPVRFFSLLHFFIMMMIVNIFHHFLSDSCWSAFFLLLLFKRANFVLLTGVRGGWASRPLSFNHI